MLIISIKVQQNSNKSVTKKERTIQILPISSVSIYIFLKGTIVQTECIAIKMECLWNSEDVYSYIDKKRVWEYIPGLQEYRFVPISNNVLAKAETPFLIFERNKGKCFIEAH